MQSPVYRQSSPSAHLSCWLLSHPLPQLFQNLFLIICPILMSNWFIIFISWLSRSQPVQTAGICDWFRRKHWAGGAESSSMGAHSPEECYQLVCLFQWAECSFLSSTGSETTVLIQKGSVKLRWKNRERGCDLFRLSFKHRLFFSPSFTMKIIEKYSQE